MKDFEIQNPHDQFVRSVFSKPEIAQDFLANYLPSEIVEILDLDALEMTQESFVDEDLRLHHTDLLYRLKLKTGDAAFVYILLEHKSSPDKWVAFQLLRYMVRIWEKERETKNAKLPPIIPLVLYHGKAKWKVSTKFSTLIKNAGEFSNSIPNFTFNLCNLSALSETEIKGRILLRFVILALVEVFNPKVENRLEEIMQILENADSKSAIELVGLFLRYYSAATNISLERFKQGLQKVFPKKYGAIMEPLAYTWIKEGMERGLQQGMQQGLEQGKQKGLQEGEANFAIKSLRKRFGKLTAQTEDKIHALPLEKLDELSEALWDFETLSDFENWLNQAETKPEKVN